MSPRRSDVMDNTMVKCCYCPYLVRLTEAVGITKRGWAHPACAEKEKQRV